MDGASLFRSLPADVLHDGVLEYLAADDVRALVAASKATARALSIPLTDLSFRHYFCTLHGRRLVHFGGDLPIEEHFDDCDCLLCGARLCNLPGHICEHCSGAFCAECLAKHGETMPTFCPLSFFLR
jgi:hypothetical protein